MWEDALDVSGDAVHELVAALEHVPMVGAAFSIISVILKRAKGVQVCSTLVWHATEDDHIFACMGCLVCK